MPASAFGLARGPIRLRNGSLIPTPFHICCTASFLLDALACPTAAFRGISFSDCQSDRGRLENSQNSPIIIDRYRTATASLDYYGDSILNSTFDVIAAMAGFWLAWKVNWKWVLLLVVAIELLCSYSVRDTLTLNLLMLVYPSEAIKQWQLGK